MHCARTSSRINDVCTRIHICTTCNSWNISLLNGTNFVIKQKLATCPLTAIARIIKLCPRSGKKIIQDAENKHFCRSWKFYLENVSRRQIDRWIFRTAIEDYSILIHFSQLNEKRASSRRLNRLWFCNSLSAIRPVPTSKVGIHIRWFASFLLIANTFSWDLISILMSPTTCSSIKQDHPLLQLTWKKRNRTEIRQ